MVTVVGVGGVAGGDGGGAVVAPVLVGGGVETAVVLAVDAGVDAAAAAVALVVGGVVGGVVSVGGAGGGGGAAAGPPPPLVLASCRLPQAGGRGFVRHRCRASLPLWVLVSLWPFFLSSPRRGHSHSSLGARGWPESRILSYSPPLLTGSRGSIFFRALLSSPSGDCCSSGASQ